MFTGLKRDEATKFSFYLSLPIIGGAVSFKLFHVIKGGDFGSLSLILVGALLAFIVGVLTIHLLLNYVKKSSLKVFSYYRFILALAILLAYFNLQVLSLITFGVAVIYLVLMMVRREKELK